MTARSWIVGSLGDCDIRVENPAVSGRHCRLTQRGESFLLEDLQSTNGTFVDGQRIDSPRIVRRGDRVTLGQNCADALAGAAGRNQRGPSARQRRGRSLRRGFWASCPRRTRRGAGFFGRPGVDQRHGDQRSVEQDHSRVAGPDRFRILGNPPDCRRRFAGGPAGRAATPADAARRGPARWDDARAIIRRPGRRSRSGRRRAVMDGVDGFPAFVVDRNRR